MRIGYHKIRRVNVNGTAKSFDEAYEILKRKDQEREKK
jgi:hypothetical protein